jgi:uncharacterized OB-fold protein
MSTRPREHDVTHRGDPGAVAGHGAALGRLRGEGDTVVAGPDEDALTLAADAAWQALARAGATDVGEVLLAAPVCSAADADTLIAALHLDGDTPLRRVPDALDAVAFAVERRGPVLVVAADHATAGALVVDEQGYASLTAGQLGGGAALADRTRDPRFDRFAGATSLLRRSDAQLAAGCPLVDVVELIEQGRDGVVASGGPARVATLAVSDVGAVPPGPLLAELRASGREPTPSERLFHPSPRPRGATGVDPDGPLLWRERAELLGPLAARCQRCHATNAPICGAVLCRRCGSRELHVVSLPRTGDVLTYCVSMTLPRALASPLALVYARLDDGTQWKALGPGMREEDLSIGGRVELVLRRLVVDDATPVYGLAFRAEVGAARQDRRLEGDVAS